MSTGPVFPPLLSGRAVAGDAPGAAAVRAAMAGAEPGLVLFDPVSDDLHAAMVLAPDVARSDAAVMLPLAGVALQNALGTIAPPEVAVHLDWDGGIRVNGGLAGQLRLIAPEGPDDAVPDWLVVTLDLRFAARDGDGGDTPGETALHAEGCGDLAPMPLLESWTRHLMHWLHDWETEGLGHLHRDFAGLVWQLGEPITLAGHEGHFLGLDERLGALVKSGGTTHLLPLSLLLETP
ncbi:biotin/lipoate--protein ligase family protein [Roseivivax sp. CAU 1753]